MEIKDGFSYTYSASQQQEVERIREKYLPKQEDKMERLRRLDRSATQKAQAWSLAVGIVGVLILGIGMSFALSDLGQILGKYVDRAMLLGVVIGLFGLVLVALAYPMYNCILKKARARIAPEIIRLSDELMK